MISIRSFFPSLPENSSSAADSGQIISLNNRPPDDVYDKIKKETGADKIYRLSVFLTDKEQLLFAAPAGPDIISGLEDLEFCAKAGFSLIQKLGIKPEIGIISGGRAGDLGRDKTVDQTILTAEALEAKLNSEGISAKHYTILIEDAIKETNFLILPDSLSGEMILKTVAGVGEGVEIGNILLLKPPVGETMSDSRIYIEQLTKKADLKNLDILKEVLAILHL
ncbi:hypothetical protein MmiEs2_07200 [Methanimicrococcus stummii]|uniref:Uncharacterized protein n=1 Tax=Methanimicrococcus stummii TaxID=3028294 RepID=A0AA96V8H1_9EURY|nr:hypothetical protein [Methanimicrococcus sp. Es2]WNY28529.1 hypothetical protein MmiEs2_07200 [Methanimicrococcus sp. Es2]